MANEMQAGTISAVLQSEIKAAAANVKQMAVRDTYMPFIDQTLNRWRQSYQLDHRESGRLIADELEQIETDDAIVTEFRRTFVGG